MLTQPSFAERVAFGRPIAPADADLSACLAPRPITALVGRVLLGAIFVVSGIPKLTSPGDTAGYMSAEGIPAAGALVIVAGFAELLGGLAIIGGFLTRLGALGLILFLIPTTLVFHDFWTFAGVEQQMQMSQFMKNLAIIGGLSLLVAHGPGRYSVDARLRRPAPV